MYFIVEIFVWLEPEAYKNPVDLTNLLCIGQG
jgi:hypothetical protein